MKKFEILLFYKYINIRNPEKLRTEQFAFCDSHGMTGRIIVGKEGINATLEGTLGAVRQYIAMMRADRRFAAVVFKRSEGTGTAFPKLSIKVRDEIVTLGASVGRRRGSYIGPREAKRMLTQKYTGKLGAQGDFEILDVRNDYETAVGYFQDSIRPDIGNFRELEEYLPQIAHLKNKNILMVCTGGIRCEKASRLLRDRGFKRVSQLEGGIVSYMKRYPNQDFLGSLYVFDNRVVMNYDKRGERVVVGRCALCALSSEHYINCDNLACHHHVIVCNKCVEEKGKYCSPECQQQVQLMMG